jgi:hypothetical protein
MFFSRSGMIKRKMVRIKRRMVNITGIIIFTGSDLKDKGVFFESESDNFIFPVKGMQISIVKVSWSVKDFIPMLLKNDNHDAASPGLTHRDSWRQSRHEPPKSPARPRAFSLLNLNSKLSSSFMKH